MQTPFYDPKKTYDENYEHGPFGAFADGAVWKPDTPPSFSFLGVALDTPFGIPAGPLLNRNFVKAAFDKGFSVCTYKTVRSLSKAVNGFPNVVPIAINGELHHAQATRGVSIRDTYTAPLSITNSFGVPSKDPSIWQADMKAALAAARPGQLLLGSFQGTPGEGGTGALVEDCVVTAQLVAETGVKVLEMNTSCPNEGTSNLLCFDIDRVESILRAINKKIQLPLILKIAYFEHDAQLREFVTRIGPLVAGISAINTIPAKILDGAGEQGLPGEGRAVSGVCGDAIRWAGIEMVERLERLREELRLSYQIVGVGGVSTAAHVQAYRESGADLVMSATGAMWNPLLGQEVYRAYARREEKS